MDLSTQLLRQEIEEAFADVPLPAEENWIANKHITNEEREWFMELMHTRLANGKILPISNEQEEQGWNQLMCFCSNGLFCYVVPRLMLATLENCFSLADGSDAFWVPSILTSSFTEASSFRNISAFSPPQKTAICHWGEFSADVASHKDSIKCLLSGFASIVKTWSPQIPNYKPLFSPQPS